MRNGKYTLHSTNPKNAVLRAVDSVDEVYAAQGFQIFRANNFTSSQRAVRSAQRRAGISATCPPQVLLEVVLRIKHAFERFGVCEV